MKPAVCAVLCCSLLTGCDNEENVFGVSGKYVMKIGEDIFGNGKTGPMGGDEPVDSQSNEEGEMFAQVDVKEVEEAPEDEKVAYNFSGPKNNGISQTNSENSAAGSTASVASTSQAHEQGTVVFLSCGHHANSNDCVELIDKRMYPYAIKVFSNKIKNGQTMGKSDSCKAVYKLVTGKNIPSGKEEESFISALRDYGLYKGNEPSYKDTVNTDKFYSIYGKKFDKLLNLINKKIILGVTLTSEQQVLKSAVKDLTGYQDSSDCFEAVLKELKKHKTDYDAISPSSNSNKVFKVMSTPGTSCKAGKDADFPEYKANYRVMKAAQQYLVSKGYTVKISRKSEDGTTLLNGKMVSNKNMATFANSEKAVVHFCFHWDDGTSHKEPKAIIAAKESKDIKEKWKALEKASKPIEFMFKDGTNKYTTCNWGTIPTAILEMGAMIADYPQYHKSSAKATIKELKNSLFKNGYGQAIVDAIEAMAG